jgi:hypothetical protein
MSIITLTDNYYKSWLNARVNNLTVDGTFNIDTLNVNNLNATNATISNNLTVNNNITTQNLTVNNNITTQDLTVNNNFNASNAVIANTLTTQDLIVNGIAEISEVAYISRLVPTNAITQTGSQTSSVILNTNFGVITTVNLNVPPSSNSANIPAVFTLINSNILSTTIVRLDIMSKTGTFTGSEGLANVSAFYDGIDGEVSIVITNVGGFTLTGSLKIAFELIQQYNPTP